MANLNDAYRNVQETIDRNNNFRQEDGGIFQSFLHDIYTDIEGDLDPANIRKPLSPYGSALDAITGFRKKQIERAADAEVAFQTAVYTANRPLEKIKSADQIRYQMEDAYRDQHYKATTGLASLYPTLKATTEDKDQLQTVIDKNPSLFTTISNAHKNGNTIKFYTEEDEIPKLAGQHIYTDPSNGNKGCITFSVTLSSYLSIPSLFIHSCIKGFSNTSPVRCRSVCGVLILSPCLALMQSFKTSCLLLKCPLSNKYGTKE